MDVSLPAFAHRVTVLGSTRNMVPTSADPSPSNSLVNSNPATIMTDPEFADATYVKPITAEVLGKVI
jgi:hypothetical protein